MGDAVWIALFALLTVLATTGASLLGVWLTARISRQIKTADYARQDAVSAKLDVIHTLVDGNMTTAMQAELDATVRELAMMREVLRLHEVAGLAPTAEALNAIEATDYRIDDLRVKLHNRLATESQIKGGTL